MTPSLYDTIIQMRQWTFLAPFPSIGSLVFHLVVIVIIIVVFLVLVVII